LHADAERQLVHVVSPSLAGELCRYR
jgi:hypothetical protein